MSREDIARLLGGYATGTLTPEEQQTLFAAALEDQALFDELAREQALRDVLSEPAARAQLLAALEDPPRRRWRFGNWMLRPAALTAAAACLLVLGAVAVWRPWRGNQPSKTDLIATALPQEAPPGPSLPAVVEQKAQVLPEVRAAAKAKAPAASHAMPAASSPATPAAKKELLDAERTSPVAMAPPAVESFTPANAMFPAASPPPPPPPKTVTEQVMVGPSITGRDAAELMRIMPGMGMGGAPANAPAIGAFSANGTQPTDAVSVASGSGAQQRYYASAGVGAAKPAVQTQGRLEAPQAPGSQPAPLGIKWSILRRQANGAFAIVNGEDLRAGDTVELRVVPNQSCDLSVFDNASGKLLPLFTKHAEAGEIVDTPLLTPGEKGLRQLVVGLTRSGNVAGGIAGALPALSREAQQSETDRSEHATYTVGPPGAQQVSLSITLNYR